MPTSSSPKPLPPVFVNERARIEEHDTFMADARRKYPGYPICPDCYNPPHLCAHMNLRRKP